MPKGKTSSPLRIGVPIEWVGRPELMELVAQGHTIIAIDALNDVDVALGPNCQNWTDEMFVEEEKKDGTKYRPYSNAMLIAARAMKRSGKRASAA